MSEKDEALADRLDDERMNLIERLADENERLREEVRNWKKSFVGHVYVKNEDYAELISKRDALKTENERLREALKWSLKNGVVYHRTYDAYEGFSDAGCGCCSSSIEPPPHLQEMILKIARREET